MHQWGVVDFVSRVAERVNPAWGNFPPTVVELPRPDEEGAYVYARLRAAMPVVEPSPEYVERLYHRLMIAPTPNDFDVVGPDRRIVYGVAALGSIAASAAVVAALVLRTRAAHRAA